MRRATWQQWLVALWAVGVVAGCGKPPAETALSVEYEKPVDGQQLEAPEDADAAAPGFQYEVVAVAKDSGGREVTLASAKLELKGPEAAEWQPGPEATVEGARARFGLVTLQPRTNLLRVTVEEKGSRRTASRLLTLTVVPRVDFATPANGQALLAGDDADTNAPGYQVRFSLRAAGFGGQKGVLYCEKACSVPPTPFTVGSDGTVDLMVTLQESACQTQAAECYALVDNAGQTQRSPKLALTLDSVAPRVEVSTPVAPVSATSFRVEAVVGCCEDGREATLERPGQAPLKASITGGAVAFPAVQVREDGRYTFNLKVTDAAGNTTDKPLEVLVASRPATLTLQAPTTVTTDADGNASNGVQVDVTASTSATEPDTVLEFFTSTTERLGEPVRMATTEAPSGGRQATVRVSLAEGANTVRACVRNAALPATCQSRLVQVSTGRASCRIVSPLPGTFRGSGPVPVVVETLATSATLRLLSANGAEASRASGSATTGRVSLEVTPGSDGEWLLVAQCGADGVSQVVPVARDTLTPTVALTVPGDTAGTGTLSAEVPDTSVRPGTQVALQVATEPLAVVAFSGCGAANDARAVADDKGQVTLRDFSLPATAPCTLSVTATDRAGNATTSQRELRPAPAASSAVAFLSPKRAALLGLTDGLPRAGGGLTVDVRLSVASGPKRTLTLFLGAQQVGTVAVDASDNPQEKLFSGVELTEGPNLLYATLISDSGAQACATLPVDVDTATRTISLRAPSNNASYSITLDRDADTPGIQAPLQYDVTGASATARVDICSSLALVPGASPCRDGSGLFTLATGVPSLSARFSFPDGRYALKAVLDDGGRLYASTPVSVTVDSVRPYVTRLSFEGDVNGDRQLNLAEQAIGAPVLLVSTVGVEEGRSVQVVDSQTGTAYGQSLVSGGGARVPLDRLPNLQEFRYPLTVLLTDAVGNTNKVSSPQPLDVLDDRAFSALRVDRTAPTLNVTSPSRALLGLADDADASQAGYQVRLALSTSADVGTDALRLTLSPPGTTSLFTPAGGLVDTLLTVPSSGTTRYTLALQSTDEAGNSTTVSRDVTVDLEAPGLVPTAPSNNAVLNSTTVTVSATVSGAEGATVNVFSLPSDNSGPLSVAALTVSNGAASGSAPLPLGVQSLRFEVRDAAGNLTTAFVTNITVNSPGCDHRLTRPSGTPATLLAVDDTQPGTAGLQYRLQGTTSVCKGRQVSLFRDGAATPEATTTADATDGSFFFDVTLPDGQATDLRLDMINDSAITTSYAARITVDITPPALSDVTPAETTLFFVADSNLAFLQTPNTPGYVKDLSAGGDAQAELSLRVTGARGGSVRVLYNGAEVATEVTPDADDKTLLVPISLRHDTSGTLEIVVRDASGNEVRRAASATVDVQPPEVPAASAVLVPGSERTASVGVNWAAVGDDETSGTPAGYDLRWTTLVALPGGISTEALFFNAKVRQASGGLLPAATTSYTLTPLPPLNTYSVQLRARDEVGNYSPFAAPLSVNGSLRTRSLTNPGGGSSFGLLLEAGGNLDGVAGDDLVVANNSNNNNQGVVYVYSGGQGTPQVLTPPDTGAQFFGQAIGVGNVGDAAGEGRPDVVVGSPGWTLGTTINSGRAFLYFGQAASGVMGVDPTPIEFRSTVTGGFFGITTRVINDINGDGLGELVISASNESGQGRVYLFFGRSRTQWEALRVDSAAPTQACTGASVSCHIPASAANRIFIGEGSNTFGRQRGFASLGDITGDGVADFTLPASRDTVGKLFFLSGATVNAATGSILTSSAFQTLQSTTNLNNLRGFGSDAIGGVNLVGGPGLDLVISHPVAGKVLVYADGGPTGYPTTPALTITGTGINNFGVGLAMGDLNGDGRQDLIMGMDRFPGGSAWVFFHTGIPGAEYDTVPGGFSMAQVTVPTSLALGISVAVGDFDGDGKADLASGDNLEGSGVVRIWY